MVEFKLVVMAGVVMLLLGRLLGTHRGDAPALVEALPAAAGRGATLATFATRFPLCHEHSGRAGPRVLWTGLFGLRIAPGASVVCLMNRKMQPGGRLIGQSRVTRVS